MSDKIIRSICYFTRHPDGQTVAKLKQVSQLFVDKGYAVQTIRICSEGLVVHELAQAIGDEEVLLSVGSLALEGLSDQLDDFYAFRNVACHLDLTDAEITEEHEDLLFQIIHEQPAKTFDFAFVFNNPPSSPFFPSARYGQEGYAIGLQPTDLSAGCVTQEAWFQKMSEAWDEIRSLLGDDQEFLGIDSSVAPLYQGESSLVNWIKRLGLTFDQSVLTKAYLDITRFIKEKNPKPVGLCGLMLPCLEDFELADEYEQGKFPLERNLFLSLHSGLGIDVYPIGVDEPMGNVKLILKTVQALSAKYQKPLSVRFVSDGKAKIGEKTDFRNQYLKDTTVRPLIRLHL